MAFYTLIKIMIEFLLVGLLIVALLYIWMLVAATPAVTLQSEQVATFAAQSYMSQNKESPYDKYYLRKNWYYPEWDETAL